MAFDVDTVRVSSFLSLAFDPRSKSMRCVDLKSESPRRAAFAPYSMLLCTGPTLDSERKNALYVMIRCTDGICLN